jgi:hypothetical protein
MKTFEEYEKEAAVMQKKRAARLGTNMLVWALCFLLLWANLSFWPAVAIFLTIFIAIGTTNDKL